MIVERYVTTTTSEEQQPLTGAGMTSNTNDVAVHRMSGASLLSSTSYTPSSTSKSSTSSKLSSTEGSVSRSFKSSATFSMSGSGGAGSNSAKTMTSHTNQNNTGQNQLGNQGTSSSVVPFGATTIGIGGGGGTGTSGSGKQQRRPLAPIRQATLFDGPDTLEEEPFFSPDVRSLAKEIGMDFEELEQHALGSIRHQRHHHHHHFSSSSRRHTSSSSSRSSSSSSSTLSSSTTSSRETANLLQNRRATDHLKLNITTNQQLVDNGSSATGTGAASSSLSRGSVSAGGFSHLTSRSFGATCMAASSTSSTSSATHHEGSSHGSRVSPLSHHVYRDHHSMGASNEPIVDEPPSSVSSSAPSIATTPSSHSRLITLQFEEDDDNANTTPTITECKQSHSAATMSPPYNKYLTSASGSANTKMPVQNEHAVHDEDKTVTREEKPSHSQNTQPLKRDNNQNNGVTAKSSSVMSRSIDRIEVHMSEVVGKLVKSFDARDLKEVVGLLNVMIRMLEKAWSVPSCGYDLGFKLCNVVRTDHGLKVILDYLLDTPSSAPSPTISSAATAALEHKDLNSGGATNDNVSKPALSTLKSPSASCDAMIESSCVSDDARSENDDSSSTLTSGDLGSPPNESLLNSDGGGNSSSSSSGSTVAGEAGTKTQQQSVNDGHQLDHQAANEEGLHEQVIFLCARLLSQCLTSDNRDYIVANGLQLVVKLACQFATTVAGKCATKSSSGSTVTNNTTTTIATNSSSNEGEQQQQQQQQHQQQLQQARIGTEILQHLFKHSEETCTDIIALGGLSAILYECRSTDCETLRHCASALANLAMYGGADSQQTMIEEKAHVWLFPLAFNSDDNVQYYACLAIAVLVANQEIEADVLKSSTLDLVEPFVTSHEPQKFATSSTSHIHGQSAPWLAKLLPLLDSKRVEARNLASFHFAMEAYIKKAQSQTDVFRAIGAVGPLQRVASSPIAIESKFACQALRLCGEQVPHRLSQQVPLWQVDDVVAWVKQIGFAAYSSAFVDAQVDGDLLLRIDERTLSDDLGVTNGLRRRRFLRELEHLKRIADYTSCDPTKVYNILAPLGAEYLQYLYPMVTNGVTAEVVHQLSDVQLMSECGVTNSVHRQRLNSTFATLGERLASAAADALDGSAPTKTLDVFVSYRRSTGSQLASLLKVHLQLRGFSVFIDVERLEAGKFDNNLLESIKMAKNFILVLTPHALDRCEGDDDCKDWVHKEIVQALASDCNIIPIFDNFQWPDADALPADMRSILYFNGVRWIHDYQDACVDKVERFIRGELANNLSHVSGGGYHTTNTSNTSNSMGAGSIVSSVSTPSPSQSSGPLQMVTPAATPLASGGCPELHPLASVFRLR
ncbi:Sterile alpha and TIR motif-containing protein 1, partial [Fragariocoptes setiger]